MPWKQAPQKATTAKAKTNARKLRARTTDAERQLWKHLRGDFAGAGSHFRRQMAIGPYIADFVCLRRKVVVEIDGRIHEIPGAKAYDGERDAFFRAAGYQVLRFENREVTLDLPSVLFRISAAFGRSTPTPNPSPQGGGGSVGMVV